MLNYVFFVFTVLVNYILSFFLLCRSGVLTAIFNVVVTPIRERDPWVFNHPDSAQASDFIRNVVFVFEKGWKLRARVVHGLVFTLVAVAVSVKCWWAELFALMCVVIYDFVVFFSCPAPKEEMKHGVDKCGAEFAVSPVKSAKCDARPRIIVPGAIALGSYCQGVMHGIFTRFGAKAFEDFGFVGASSGAWVAAWSMLTANGAHDMRHWTLGVFATVCRYADLLPTPWPLGVLWVANVLSHEGGSWTVRTIQNNKDKENAYNALAYEGKLAWWLYCFGSSETTASKLGRAYRLVVQGGRDMQDPDKFGWLTSATALLPFLTFPGLCCGSLSIIKAALDGYFPGSKSSLGRVPDLTAPFTGSRLILDIGYDIEVEDDVHRLNVGSWRKFKDTQCMDCSADNVIQLFWLGVRDANEHAAEIDGVFATAFGMRPIDRANMGA